MNDQNGILKTTEVAPSAWCDRRCDRCAQTAGCELYQTDLTAREIARLRGEPEPPPLREQIVTDALDRSLAGVLDDEETPLGEELIGGTIEPHALAQAGVEYAVA